MEDLKFRPKEQLANKCKKNFYKAKTNGDKKPK